jgi:putative transposase
LSSRIKMISRLINFILMKQEIGLSKEHAEFLTVTCLEWNHVLLEDRFKDIITESLTYLVKARRIYVYGFVIMSNHFHLIWQMTGVSKRNDVQRDFLKFTSQQIIKTRHHEQLEMLKKLEVNAKDRKHQVWERNSLGVPLWTPEVFWQKLDYIHNNPVKAGLCKLPGDYKYSSARFYEKNEKDWVFLTHHEG